MHLGLPPALGLQVLTLARMHALLLFARGLCAPCLWLCGYYWLVAKDHSIQLQQHARAHVFRTLPVFVCVSVWCDVCMYGAGAATLCAGTVRLVQARCACLFAPQRVARVLVFIPKLLFFFTGPSTFGDHFLVFCVYDLHQPLGYGC